MDFTSGATRRSLPSVSRLDTKGPPDGSQADPPAIAGYVGSSASHARFQGLVQPDDLPSTPVSSRPARLPGRTAGVTDLPDGKGTAAELAEEVKPGAEDATHQTTAGSAADRPAAPEVREASLVKGLQAVGREARTHQLPWYATPSDAVMDKRDTLHRVIEQGVQSLLRDVPLDSDADVLALVRTLVPAIEANFDTQFIPGSAAPGETGGFTPRTRAISALLACIRAKRPVECQRLAQEILTLTQQPKAWTFCLLCQPDRKQIEAMQGPMLDCIIQVGQARGHGGRWQVEAVHGVVLAQRQMWDAVAFMLDDWEGARQAIAQLPGTDPALPQAMEPEALKLKAQGYSAELRLLACERARDLVPDALADLVSETTILVESIIPSKPRDLAFQAGAALRVVMESAGVAPEAVAAALRGLVKGMELSHPSDAHASIHGALILALGEATWRYFDQLKAALLPLAVGDAGKAEVARMVDASREKLARDVLKQVPL